MLITFEGETAAEIRGKILDFVKTFGVNDSPAVLAPVAELPAKEKKTKKEKPAKDEVAPEAPVSSVTKADVIAALEKVNSTKGMPAAREVLKSFGASRISEISEDKFGDFVQACTAAVG